MIPVVTLNSKGEVVGQQAFNDNLTEQEELNRIMLATLFCAQQKLTNDKNKLDKIIASGNYTATELTGYVTAATTLYNAVESAIKTFETAIG